MKVHAIISAAMNLAVRYDWIEYNPAERATLPKLRKREPDPPSPKDAARLLNEVFGKDEEFGLSLWAAMTTGARRGELLALREDRFDRLSTTYPPFRFSHKPVGPRGPRWIAQRKDSAVPGLRTVITAHLAELREALTSDQARVTA